MVFINSYVLQHINSNRINYKPTLLIELCFYWAVAKRKTMKNYYVECTVCFTDNSEAEHWKSKEIYSFIVEAKNRKLGKAVAEQRGIEEFESDMGKGMDDVRVIINAFYETCEGARAN